MRFNFTLLLLISVALLSLSKTYGQPPADYYDAATGLDGIALKKQLHKIIRAHEVFSYNDVRQFISINEADPANAGNIILFYTGRSQDVGDFANDDDSWNREHVWPQSHGIDSETDTAYTDFHHLRPADASVNTSRSNKDFNEVDEIPENEQGEAPDTFTDNDFWEPRDAIKGDVARMVFYMDVRYNSDFFDMRLEDRETFTGEPALGVLYTLLQWHENDPVDQTEIDRNNAIFDTQGNRNPFVDEPDYVNQIWGTSTAPVILINTPSFDPDFGFVTSGNEKVQVYSINSYNVVENITVSVDDPFQVSLDGVNWTNSLLLPSIAAEQTDDIYLRFAPTAEGTFEASVTHETNGAITQTLEIEGTEGEVQLLSIAEARTKALGESVLITGVVIDGQNNSSNNRVLYDGTAGIMLRSFDSNNESAPLVKGDSVVVEGRLGDYNNLLQISESPISIDLIKSNATIPEPQLITVADLGEEYESELVRINNLEFVSSGTFQGGGSAGNFNVTDGSDQFIFRIGSSSHPLVGEPVPTVGFDLIGIVGQFQSDYQVSPRDESDLILEDEQVTSIVFNESGIKVYPNPANNRLHIEGITLSEQDVNVFDLRGKSMPLMRSKNYLDISSYSSGVYIVQINGEQVIRILKK